MESDLKALSVLNLIFKYADGEIVFHHPRVRSLHLPPKDDCIKRVCTAKLLGVMFRGNVKFETHIQYILTLCNQCLYLLKLLRNRGICSQQLYIVFHALIMSRLMYALPA